MLQGDHAPPSNYNAPTTKQNRLQKGRSPVIAVSE